MKKFYTLCEQYTREANGDKRAGKLRAILALGEAIRDKRLSAENVSIREVYEAIMEQPVPAVRGDVGLITSEAAINTQLFVIAVGKITQFTLMQGYEETPRVARAMIGVVGTSKRQGRKARIVPPDGRIPIVTELETYTNLTASDEYITYACNKYGASIPISMETIREDDTGQILGLGAQLGRLMAETEEYVILEAMVQAVGGTSVYKPAGTATDIYTATAALYRTNVVASNPLENWKSLQAARKAAQAIRISANAKAAKAGVKLRDMLVPADLEEIARNVLFARSVRTKTAGDPATETESENPIVEKPQLFVSSHLTDITPFGSADATKTWYIGDFKRAFSLMQVAAMRVETQTGGEKAFTNDIPLSFKVYGEFGICCDDPRFIIQCTG